MSFYYNIHRHSTQLRFDEIAIVNKFPTEIVPESALYSCGIHPWYIVENQISEDLIAVESALQSVPCIALGECGMDNRMETEMTFQQDLFEKQLDLAKQYNKPVIVHCVGAYAEVLASKKRLDFHQPMIFHGFSKNSALAKQLQNAGCYVSFGKYLMTQEHLLTVLKDLNLQRIFLETDSSDFEISEIYNRAAIALQLPIDELQEILKNNFLTVFKREN